VAGVQQEQMVVGVQRVQREQMEQEAQKVVAGAHEVQDF
jgi:hypothetical protein